ncbi:hypothetical protein AYI68_g2523 [Smittium mucronatum]|uniref:Uncharacterized protein n=1 Tax=Smittium mucronatum TaxID=133383 RepID=A0A1R0H2K6_9FUNG|nr:hypothetical protein AYI68_g2523 [Smittium mucronatum]
MEYDTFVLIIFVHGFMGSTDSFCDFPERLQAILSAIHTDKTIECIVYPTYKTRNELVEAVQLLKDWILDFAETKHKEEAIGTSNSKKIIPKKINIVLVGHSMGGLLISDAAIQILPILDFFNSQSKEYIKNLNDNGIDETPESKPIFAHGGLTKIVGVLAFDSPFFGINHQSLSLTALSKVNEVGGHIELTKNISAGIFGDLSSFWTSGESLESRGIKNEKKSQNSSFLDFFNSGLNLYPGNKEKGGVSSPVISRSSTNSGKSSKNPDSSQSRKYQNSTEYESSNLGVGVALATGAIAAAGLAAVAYFNQDKISSATNYLNEHLCFVSSLYKRDELWARMEKICSYASNCINNKPKPVVFGFHCFYNLIKVDISKNPSSLITIENKKFIELPNSIKVSDESGLSEQVSIDEFFTPIISDMSDEVSSHTNMFDTSVTKLAFIMIRDSVSQINVFLKNSL